MNNSSSPDASAHDPAPQVRVAQGLLAGEGVGEIVRFLGVPYAAAPVRFELPVPPEPWEGVREATDPGPCYPHVVKELDAIEVVPLVGTGGMGGRDYLRANVWAPAGAHAAPVMVWIHGGGFVAGSKDAPATDGSAFARSGVVCAAINYRMGIDGFLPVPGAPTNLGLRDMLLALQWVQDNIAAFGGDPANVTVFGESAGAMAIANLVTSPLAKGLFRKAIVQSGHGSMVREIPVAMRLTRALAKRLKVSPDASGLRGASDEAIFAAIEKLGRPTARIDLRDAGGHEPVFGISRFIPVYGDDVLPEHPLAALRGGAGSEIDMLIGTNAEEMNLYFVPTGVRKRIPGFLARWLLGKSHPDPRAVLRDYGLGRGAKAGEAMTRAMSDLVFRWPARQFAAAHQGLTWFYEFDWGSPACGGELGACHALDVPFVFDTLACATGPKGLAGTSPPQSLADRVHALWVRFAGEGTLPWAEYGADAQVYQLARGEAIREARMPAADHLPD